MINIIRQFQKSHIYIYICVISGVIIDYYLYKESFEDFYEYYDYNRKYYYYFFLIVLITLSLVIYTGNISREKTFKQREMQRERVGNEIVCNLIRFSPSTTGGNVSRFVL
jgi:hypothetical protein